MALQTSSRGSEDQGVEMVSHNVPKRDKSPESAENSLGPVEYRKVGINVGRKMSFLWALVLLAPVAVSFAILQFSFRTFYWRDARKSGTAELLGVFQIAAKAHEILIVFSLSKLILYYLQLQLSSDAGIPFGIFSSGFAQTLGQVPLSHGFWLCWIAAVSRRTRWRVFLFGLLVLLVTLIGLTAGPASAVALIPQLRWWHRSDLFSYPSSSKECSKQRHSGPSDYSLYLPKQVFPVDLNESSLPGPFCLNRTLDPPTTCPFSSLDLTLAQMNWTGLNNYTIGSTGGRTVATTGGPIPPYLSSSDFPIPLSLFAWTTNQIIANVMYIENSRQYVDNGIIKTVEARRGKGKRHALSSPVTDVSCEVRPASTYARNLTFAIDPSSVDVGGHVGGDDPSIVSNNVDLRDIWSEATLKKPPHTMVQWEEFEDPKGVMRLKALILTPGDSYGPANVSICNVAATWVPTTYSRIQSQGEGVVTNFTFIRNQGRSPV